MTIQGRAGVSAALAAAFMTLAVRAKQVPTIADFLTTIGGNTEIKTTGSMRTHPDPQVYPLLDNPGELLGYRFFSEKLTANGSGTAERGRAAFAQECAAKGGRIEPDDSDVARAFQNHVLGRKLPPRGGFKHFWAGISAVCSRSASQVLGGYVAITFDTTEVATKGDIGSRLLSRISLQPTKTAIYAYSPGLIRPAAFFAQQRAAYVSDRAAEDQRRAAFRATLAIGTETNCGTVIQLRGPMAEIAVPPTTLTPNGQSSFWSRRDRLAPPYSAICTFGQ